MRVACRIFATKIRLDVVGVRVAYQGCVIEIWLNGVMVQVAYQYHGFAHEIWLNLNGVVVRFAYQGLAKKTC